MPPSTPGQCPAPNHQADLRAKPHKPSLSPPQIYCLRLASVLIFSCRQRITSGLSASSLGWGAIG